MSFDFDLLVEDHFKKHRDVYGFESIATLIEEVMNASTLEEAQDSVQKKAQEFLLVLPKFTPTEAWGNPESMERQQINRLFAVMGGGRTIEGKLKFLQQIANPQNKITSPRRIISSLIILEALSAVITSFNAASAGFVFEGFLAALLQGEQEAEISAMGNLPIQDLIAFSDREEAARPISLKLLGPKTNIEGSYTNLVDGLDEFGEMIYIVARKDGDAIALEQFRFNQDNFLDALYLDARGKGKKSGASLITLSALGLDAEDSLAQLKAVPSWEERYELLQQTDGYSGAVRAKKERLRAAQEAEEAVEAEEVDVAADTVNVEAAQEELHEAIREEWMLLTEGAKQHTQWSISVPQLLSFDFVEYQTLGVLPYSTEQIVNVAAMHMDKLNGDLMQLFGATKDLSENINKYFTFDKRDRAISSGEKALQNTAQIEESLRAGLEQTEAEPEALQEDADDDRDFEIEEAIRDGEADGASGAERTPPHSFASRYYNDAYDRAAKKSK